MKKIISIVIAIIIILAIAFGVWYFFFKGKTLTTTNPFGEENGFGSFFDIQNSGNENFNGITGSTTPILDQNGNVIMPILRQLSVEPVSGFTVYSKEFEVEDRALIVSTTTATSTPKMKKVNKYLFRFMERATGHVFEAIEDTLDISKISNSTFQKVNVTLFFDDPNKMLLEREGAGGENIDSYLAEIKKVSTSTDETKLITNPMSIVSSEFVLSPDRKSFAYLVKQNDFSSVIVSNKEKTKEEIIYVSPVKNWLLGWQSSGTISINNKPTSGEPGYMYFLNTKTKAINKEVSGVLGLTTLTNSDSSLILYGETEQNTINLYIAFPSTGQSKRLPVSALPEKCVFSNLNKNKIYCAASNSLDPGLYPDDWYKGLISFNDLVWEIDISTNFVKALYVFDREKYGDFDVINPNLTKDDKFLTFTNKKDLTLWSLDISRIGEMTTKTDSPSAF